MQAPIERMFLDVKGLLLPQKESRDVWGECIHEQQCIQTFLSAPSIDMRASQPDLLAVYGNFSAISFFISMPSCSAKKMVTLQAAHWLVAAFPWLCVGKCFTKSTDRKALAKPGVNME